MDSIVAWFSVPTNVTLVVTGAISVASFLVQMIPNPAVDGFLNKVIKVLNFFALNWGTDKSPTPPAAK